MKNKIKPKNLIKDVKAQNNAQKNTVILKLVVTN